MSINQTPFRETISALESIPLSLESTFLYSINSDQTWVSDAIVLLQSLQNQIPNQKISLVADGGGSGGKVYRVGDNAFKISKITPFIFVDHRELLASELSQLLVLSKACSNITDTEITGKVKTPRIKGGFIYNHDGEVVCGVVMEFIDNAKQFSEIESELKKSGENEKLKYLVRYRSELLAALKAQIYRLGLREIDAGPQNTLVQLTQDGKIENQPVLWFIDPSSEDMKS